MSYCLLENEKGFDIIEKSTDNVLQLNYKVDKAREICESLNTGSGFSGWTPSFFSVKFKK